MNCREFEIGWSALDDSVGMTPELESHRRGCRRCSALLKDLDSIRTVARSLRLEQEPPLRVWVALRNHLESEGVLREPREAPLRPNWRTVPWTGWLFRFPMGVAYAAVFFFAVGVMYLHTVVSNPGAPPMLATAPQVPEITLPATQNPERDQSVAELIAKVPEEHRATFVSNWNQVNSSIDHLSEFVGTHPDDPFGRQQLMNAFQQRERLWETLVRWEEF